MRSARSLFFLVQYRWTAGRFGAIAAAALGLAACEEASTGGVNMAGSERASHAVSPEMVALMHTKGVDQNAPVLIRTYKKEAEFEIWKMKPDGRYTLLRTYPMCRWSGQLGPKTREGDRQVPEGFYKITPGQMNPNSNYYLSFNVGYPNAYDRAWGHEGGSIMVHGACSSAGCFSMTDRQIDEIYALARDGFSGGQRAIQMQSYPFHMTPDNMAKYRMDPNIGFWKQLKDGSDHFDVTRQDVQVGVCARHYVFNAVPADGGHFDATAPCPALKHEPGIQADVAEKARKDDAKVADLVAGGLAAVHTVYADGGQNPEFAKADLHNYDISRPEAIAAGPTDWLIESKSKKISPVVKVAAAKSAAAAAKVAAKTKPDAATPRETVADAAADRTSSVRKTDPKAPLPLTGQAPSAAPVSRGDDGPLPRPEAAADPAPRVVAGDESVETRLWSSLVHAVKQ